MQHFSRFHFFPHCQWCKCVVHPFVCWCWRFDVMHGSLHLTLSVRFFLICLSHSLSCTLKRARSLALFLFLSLCVASTKIWLEHMKNRNAEKSILFYLVENFQEKYRRCQLPLPPVPLSFAPLYSLHNPQTTKNWIASLCVCIWPILWWLQILLSCCSCKTASV